MRSIRSRGAFAESPKAAAALVAMLSAALMAMLWGCQSSAVQQERADAAPIQAQTPAASAEPRARRPEFDGANAFEMLKRQCEFGPRPPGTEAARKTRAFLIAQLRQYADQVETQDFTYRDRVYTNREINLSNIVGIFHPEAKRRVLLCAHWDTRPVADMEMDAQKRRQPILGANDGASGVAVLLELARLFKQQKPEVGVVMVFLDGEDYGDWDRMEGVLLGAKHFARNMKKYRLEYGILLDMIGDRNLQVYREVNSERYAPHVNDRVFRIARELGLEKNVIDQLKTEVIDDHIPINEAGLPTINLIDFDYAYWHTLEDTVDKCSPQSLAIIGSLVAETVYREKVSERVR
jgi:glutaminyl-peptide cyclotransferase